MDVISFLYKSIDRGEANPKLKKAREDAIFGKAVYTGKKQKDILEKYRTKETDLQKEQRNRITITRTKHTTRQIENVIDQLDIMSKPSINITCDDKNQQEELNTYIDQNRIADLAFKYVKYYNLTDSNAFLTCGLNSYDEIEYTPVSIDRVYDYYVINNKLKIVVFFNERIVPGTENEKVRDFTAYTTNRKVVYKNTKGVDPEVILKLENEGNEIEKIGDQRYISDITNTEICYAFRLGFMEDMTNNMETCVTILDAASELLKGLIWQGSELDTIDATQGIIKQFAYAQRCTYVFKHPTNPTTHQCVGGNLRVNGAISESTCPQCKGSGIETHTSSQDILYYPMPGDPKDMRDLSKFIHTEFIPTNMLEYKQKRIKELEEGIIKTVFNSSMVTKDDIDKTATEVTVDLQGIYAVLNQIGKQVTACFTWMVRCASFIKHEKDCNPIHGYVLSLTLETLETLAVKRKLLIESNAPSILLRAVDRAMIVKENMSNPIFLAKYEVWESFRAFTDKSPQEVSTILSGLPETNPDKILYNFFDKIRSNIERDNEEAFYGAKTQERQKMIDAEIEKIAEQIKKDSLTPSRTTFEDI